ncbi:hypothetical protein [Pseudomonas aeruginosa]|uniref:hypothetical protein n=1 Tax=Pseudomonas aeruginosa TaxID=287 RepID=UPI001D191C20|nr:hypothetical protein [Pseudomonas aeruginosa]MCC4281550.1 hypothetical protein [Pseudomonas aeruginosa]MEC4070386.1 hypothetical protein [Pseudomonas aeruginosa]HBO2700928.1 hypothetical protein [Pseudomonas aeruginosa]HEP9710535.1 hypothetical protein [Pseudomonas aeruginosa]
MKAFALLPLLLALAACAQSDDGGRPRSEPSLQERFYSGCARPGEFITPESLPAIPPSFDEDVQ